MFGEKQLQIDELQARVNGLEFVRDVWKRKAAEAETKPCERCLERETAAILQAEKLRRESELRAIIKPIVREELAAAKRNRS